MINTLLDPDLDPNVIATTQPVGVESNALFIVDLKCLKHTKDIMCDDLGAWKNNGCHNTWVTVDSDGLTETRGKFKPCTSNDQDTVPYKVCKRYYVNKASSRLSTDDSFFVCTCSTCNAFGIIFTLMLGEFTIISSKRNSGV